MSEGMQSLMYNVEPKKTIYVASYISFPPLWPPLFKALFAANKPLSTIDATVRTPPTMAQVLGGGVVSNPIR